MAYKFQLGSSSLGGSVRVGPIVCTGSVTAGTSFIIGSADLSETDLEKLDGITDGTAAANKAVVLDGSKNIATIGTVGCGAITTTGLLSSSVGAVISGSVMLGGATTVSGTLSASLNMHANQLQVANTEASGSTLSGSNAMMFIDGTDGFLKGMTFQNYASQIAGSGITATDGKLSAGGGSDSLTITNVAVSGTCVAGMNYMDTISSSVGVALPASPSSGDIVYVKAGLGLDPAASPIADIEISGATASHRIDGEVTVRLESPFASIGIVYVATNLWRII